MYDIIGDIHGHADQLEALLKKMGYQEKEGVYQHPERTLVSVGDLIDRGPKQRRSVDIVRTMCEQGFAHCIMGNHEFNAIAWVSKDEQNNYLREHSTKNRGQHANFLKEAEQDPDWHIETINWFKTLPLYLDLPELRVVHACWHDPSLAVLNHYATKGVLNPDAWVAANTKGHPLYDAIEVLCKGWEISLLDDSFFLDKDNNPRTRIRTKWWLEGNSSYQDLAMGVPSSSRLPTDPVPNGVMPGYDNQKPLFIGHYWMKGIPTLLTDTIACVDWSVAAGGEMVGYRLNGSSLSHTQFFTA